MRILAPAWADILRSAPEEKSFHPPSKSMIPEPCLLVEQTPTISSWCFFAFSINSNSFPVRVRTFQLPNSSLWWFSQKCATWPWVPLLCAVLDRLSKHVAGKLVELSERLAGGECRLLFERVPLPMTRTRFFLFYVTTDAAWDKIFGTIIQIGCSLICLRRDFISKFFFS